MQALTPLPSFEPSPQASYGSHRLPSRLLHPDYSRQTDRHKEYANVNSYPDVSHKYGQIPFHQSPGSTKHGLPMYKRDVLPRNLAIPNYDSSRSGGTRSLNTIPGDFLGNSAAASNLPAVGYNMPHNQIPKDANHFAPHGLVRILSLLCLSPFSGKKLIDDSCGCKNSVKKSNCIATGR